MEAIELKSYKNKYLISLDKSYFNKEILYNLLERLRIEYLAKKINFNKSIEDLGEEIKEEWWKKNKDKFLRKRF